MAAKDSNERAEVYASEAMPRTVILSEETLRALLEANASLAAWYHEFVRASREQTPVSTPGDVTRKAFLDRLAAEHPEVAQVVSTMQVPPIYVPPPLGSSFGAFPNPNQAAGGYGQPQPSAQYGQPSYGQAPPSGGSPDDGRPPMVNPRLVKY
jgi:hypothetical protein